MTNQAMIEAVLTACGWKARGNELFKPCDLLNSLDACHEVFEKDAPDEYWEQVETVVATSQGLVVNEFDVCKATAYQRCEAFLRWKGIYE